MVNNKNIKEDLGAVQEGRKNAQAIVSSAIHSQGEVIYEMKWLVTITTSFGTTKRVIM